MEKFLELKNEILKRAKEKNACSEQYSLAIKSETINDGMQLIKDNFKWLVANNVIDGKIIDDYKELFNTHQIWHNVSVNNGYLLVENSSVVARGNSSVEARGNSYISSYSLIECKLNDYAVYRVRSLNKIICGKDLIVEKNNN